MGTILKIFLFLAKESSKTHITLESFRFSIIYCKDSTNEGNNKINNLLFSTNDVSIKEDNKSIEQNDFHFEKKKFNFRKEYILRFNKS